MSRTPAVLLAAVAGVAACTDVTNAPADDPASGLDESVFHCKVEPILARDCSYGACHGIDGAALRIYRPGLLRATTPDTMDQAIVPLTTAERHANFLAAAGFAFGGIAPEDNYLLRKPLPGPAGGYEHQGGAIYVGGTDDARYQTIHDWLSGEGDVPVKRAALLVVSIAISLAPRAARAFPTGLQFDNDPLNLNMRGDGGGGIAFTGAPRFAGHTCAVCHTDAPGLIGLRLESDHPEVFTAGWKAGQVYHLRVILTGEWAGVQYKKNADACGDTSADPFLPCDTNGFALEMDDPQGVVVGKLAPLVNGACGGGTPTGAEDAYILKDGSAAIESGAQSAQTAWDLCWTAPGAGASTITAYITAVDGNGGDGTADFPNDPIGDDVAAGQVAFPEMGAPVLAPQTGGCDAGGGGAGLALAIAILLLANRRRARAALLLAVVGLGLGGCAHVRPHQRETLAARRMKFAPDPAEDELDLHMQESREGSAGGYGSAGGGCGCN